jgi:hypothetical protein
MQPSGENQSALLLQGYFICNFTQLKASALDELTKNGIPHI